MKDDENSSSKNLHVLHLMQCSASVELKKYEAKCQSNIQSQLFSYISFISFNPIIFL